MTVDELTIIARGLAPVLHALMMRVATVEMKEKGLDGAPGPLGPRGPEGPAGRDGRDGLSVAGPQGEKGQDGVDGKDGLGLGDLSVLHDGERDITFRLRNADQVKEFTITVPVEIYRGVYLDGKSYVRGDNVTWSGSEWHCNEPTSTKPGDGSKSWTLKVKRGRDGRDGRDGTPPPHAAPVVKI